MVAGIVRIAAPNRPHLAHALWILVLIKCVTPPLWGHSLGVFSHIQELAAPEEVAAEIEDANLRVDTIEVDELANPEASLEMPEMADSEAMISANDELLEPQFDAEPQRREVAEEAWDDETQTDLASLGLNDSALEIPPLEPEVDAHAAEKPASPVIDKLPSLLFGGFLIGSIITLTTMVIRCLRCLRQIRLHQTTEFDDVLRDRIQQLAKQLRIRRIPSIVVSDVLFGPAVLGLLRHTIVLPRCLFDHVGDGWQAERRKSPDDLTLSVMQRQQSEDLRPAARQNVLESGPADSNLQFLDPILAHELLHIRRGDLRTGTLQAIVQSLWWFHPAVWFCNRWLSREAERCCDEQVIAELGCTPVHYARSLLSVIECKHRLQPIPVFPGMKPVEITSQRMERIMSLKNGLKKRTPIWCWLMIVALAFVVLPGAVAQPASDEQPPAESASDSDFQAREAAVSSAPQVEVSTKTYDVSELLTRLAEDESISTEDASTSLVGIFERAVPPVMETPQGFPALPKVPASPSILAPPLPRQLSSISIDGDQLTVVQSDTGHTKLKEEMDRFRKFGFKRFQVTARSIMGSAEEINALMSSLKMVEPFSDIAKAPVADAKSEQSAVTTIQMGTTEIVSRDRLRAIEELARSKTDCLSVECLEIQSFNGQTGMTHVGEMKPYIIGFNENDEPTIRTVIDGMTLHVTPTVLDDGLIMLQCVSRIETVSKTQAVDMSRSSGKLPKRIQVPVIESKQVQTVVELQDDQTLWLSGLTSSHAGKSQAILFTLEVTLISLPYDIVDQPHLDGIRRAGDRVGSQLVANHGESVSTEKPMDQSTTKAQESTSLRVPALPLPRWISNSSDPLVKLVWDARHASHRRLLMTDQRTPWQFMNGLAALRGNFLIREGDEAVVGLDWLQNCKAFPGQQWFQKSEFGGQPNPNPAPLWFDGHAAQFVATLAMNDVPLDATFATADGTITVGDMVKHLQMTVNEKKLTPWTLIALSKYLPRNEKWSNADGETWSIERLVQIELAKESYTVTPLSLMSLAVARNHYFPAGETLDGIWLQANQRILAAIEKSMPKQTSDGRIITTYAPNFQSPHFQYRSRFGPRNRTPKSKQTYLEQAQLDLEGQRHFRLAAFPTDIRATNRAQMLLFLILALPTNQLGEDWVRREIETIGNELVADWSDREIRPPFNESTQALTVYLERYPKYLEYVAEAGLSPVLAGNNHVQVRVKGMVRPPSSYKFVGNNGIRLLEVITKAGGPSDESADTVSVIRKVGKQPLPTVLHVNLKRLKSGADPNFYVMPGDELLVHPEEIVKLPLEASIRLDDNFILSPDAPIDGSTVILHLNDKPITVERFIAGGWDRLQRTPGVSDTQKRAIVCELIKTDLPQFVDSELLLQHFAVEAPEYGLEDSRQQREAADKLFLENFERSTGSVTNSQLQAKSLAIVLAKDSTVLVTEKKKNLLARYTRGMKENVINKNQEMVTRHVRELVTQADLRRRVSLSFKDASLSDVARSIATEHGINIALSNVHVQIAGRITGRPGTIVYHCENQPLGEAIKAIVEPYGLCIRLSGETVLIECADDEQSLAKFRALPGPPSFAVFGIVKNTGWQKLEKEIRLLDAIKMAGGVEDSEGVSIAITNPDILEGKAIPVTMSLRVLQNDKSGKLNRVVKDGDMINVTRSELTESPLLKNSSSAMSINNEVNRVITLTGTGLIVVPNDAQNDTAEPNHKSNLSTLTPATYEASVLQKLLGPGRAPREVFPTPDLPMPPAIQQSSDPLVKQVWQMRDSTRRRLLSTDQFTPWQLMLGLNGLRRDFVLKHDGKVINGLEWIQTGPMFDGEPWFQKTAHGGQAHPYTKPYAFQGHINQFAATLAMCDVPLDAQFGTPDGPITMEDMVKNAQMTANEKEEVCWTLQLLSKYLPPDAEWVNANGEKWNIERLVKTAINKATSYGSPDGGTFGLFALAVARNEYLRTGKPLTGAWLDADKAIQKHMQLVYDQRNPNGTLSSNYFRGREENKNFDKRLASSGALLEFLMMAASEEQLKEDWVRQAVEATAKDIDHSRRSFVSCSPLFRATNALSIFLDRIAARAVVNIKPKQGQAASEPRFVICTYPVADLVVFRQPAKSTTGQSAVADDPAPQPVNIVASLAVAPENSADPAEKNPLPTLRERKAPLLNSNADFAPLTELIKATVQPDSWAPLGAGTIAIEEKLLCLVIRQTDAAHGEICDLLSQLRKANDHMISISNHIVKLTDDAQVEWLGTQCSLHSLENGTRWALLPKQRSEAFTRELLLQKPEVLSAPKVMTISGQTATIQVGQTNNDDDTTIGLRLEMTPHLLPNTKVFRLQHAVQIGKFSAEVLLPVESLVGSGQSLLLLLNAASENKEPEVPTSKYLLLITPEYVPLVEEEETLSKPHPDTKTELNP